jgi:hypothetical protein
VLDFPINIDKLPVTYAAFARKKQLNLMGKNFKCNMKQGVDYQQINNVYLFWMC